MLRAFNPTNRSFRFGTLIFGHPVYKALENRRMSHVIVTIVTSITIVTPITTLPHPFLQNPKFPPPTSIITIIDTVYFSLFEIINQESIILFLLSPSNFLLPPPPSPLLLLLPCRPTPPLPYSWLLSPRSPPFPSSILLHISSPSFSFSFLLLFDLGLPYTLIQGSSKVLIVPTIQWRVNVMLQLQSSMSKCSYWWSNESR